MAAPIPGLINKPGDGKNPERVRSALEKICNVLNSLLLNGDIVQTGPATFDIPGALGGTVTSVGNGTGLAGGPITSSGNLSIANTAVSAGSYTNTNLTVNAQGQLTAAANGSAGTDPLTTKGDVFTFSSVPARLPVGSDGQVLSANSSASTGLQWENAPAGTDPLTTKGDIFTFSSVAARLPVGSDGQVLEANSSATTGLQWANASAGNSPLTTKGDLYGFANTNVRVPVGSDGLVLTANSAATNGLDWESVPGGSGNDPISSVYPVFSVTGSDDEFSGSTFPTGWTSVNSGSHAPTITEINNTLSFLMAGSDASGEMHAYMKAPTITTGSYVETAFRGMGIASNFQMAGILFADGTTYTSGKQVAVYLVPTNGVSNCIQYGAWTGYNSQGSTTTASIGLPPFGDLFLRLVYSAANTFVVYISADGISWVQASGNISVTMTPNNAGFFVSTFGSAATYNWNFRYVKFR